MCGDLERKAGDNSRLRTRRSSRHSNDLRCKGVQMRQAYNAWKLGDGANYLKVFLGSCKLSVWTSVKVRECYNEVEHGLPEADHRAS